MATQKLFFVGPHRIILAFRIAVSLLFIAIIFHALPIRAQTENDSWVDHAESVVDERVEALPFEVSGRYRIDYLGRWNGNDEDDQQLFQYLKIKVDDIVKDKVSLRFSGRLSAELNGNDDGDDFFADIYDTFDHSLNGRIYYLYLDVKDPLVKDSKLRVGRQYSYEPQSLYFTGAKYEQEIRKARFYVQGGFNGSNYSSEGEDDLIGGVGVDYHVLPYTHVGYDYLRVDDDDLDDDYHNFDVAHRFGGLKTYARVSILNGDADDLNLYGTYYHIPLDLSLTARYYTLLTQRDKNTNEFAALIDVDGFDLDDDDTLAVYSPFHLINLTAYRGYGDRFGTSIGFETRWMDDSDEENDLNREYDRYFISVEAWNFIWSGLTATVTFEFWDADGSEDSLSVGIDAQKDVTDRLTAAAGFYFSRYRLRTAFGSTSFSEDIETPELYGSLKYKLREDIALAARYQVEDESDFGTTHELYLSCAVDF